MISTSSDLKLNSFATGFDPSVPNGKKWRVCLENLVQKPFRLNKKRDAYLFTELWNTVVMPSIKENKDDLHIYHSIHTFMNEKVYPKIGYPEHEDAGRADHRIKIIRDMIIENASNFPERFVDIGCSEGSITALIGTEIGMEPEKVFGIDILPKEQVVHQEGFQYIQVDPQCIKLPFENNSVSVVCMIMSLHHTRDPLQYISEIYRVLTPGGLFIIREHDVKDEIDKAILDALHALYCISWAKTGEQEDPEYQLHHYAVYKSKEMWTSLMNSVGLARLESVELNELYRANDINRYYTESKFNKYMPNSVLAFWGCYQKPAY